METIKIDGIERDIRETALNSYAKGTTCQLFSEERKWINKALRLAEKYPDEVKLLTYDPEYGSILIEAPIKWMKFSPTKKVSEEQRKAASERFKNIRKNNND